jgi:hypothetical protein
MFGDSRIAGQVVHGAECQHQVIKRQDISAAVEQATGRHRAAGQIDRFDFRVVEPCGRKDAPRRTDDLAGLDLPAEHFLAEAMEGLEIVAADDREVDATGPDVLAKAAREIDRDTPQRTRHVWSRLAPSAVYRATPIKGIARSGPMPACVRNRHGLRFVRAARHPLSRRRK